MPGVQGGASAHAGWTVVRHECSSHRFLDPSYLHPICHNFTLQHDRLQSVTTTATKQKIQGELRRIPRRRTSENSVKAKFAQSLKAEVGVPRRAVPSPRRSTKRRRRRTVDFLRKRLPAQVGTWRGCSSPPARRSCS